MQPEFKTAIWQCYDGSGSMAHLWSRAPMQQQQLGPTWMVIVVQKTITGWQHWASILCMCQNAMPAGRA